MPFARAARWKSRRESTTVTGTLNPLRVAYVNLAFADVPDGTGLLDRLPTATRFCESLSARPGISVTAFHRFHRDEDLVREGVLHRFRADDPEAGLATPWTRPAALLALLRGHRPDVVHWNGFLFSLQLAAAMAVTARRPVYAVQHHAGAPEEGWRGRLQKLVHPIADGFLFTAEAIARPWRKKGVLGAKPVFEVVEGSCDFTPVDRTAARAAAGLDGNPAVLWVGRLHPRKDPVTALRGFARALDRLPGATLTMAYGEAPLVAEVEAFCASSPRLAERIRLVGRLPHEGLPAWYSAADLFLTSSPDEGSNYALIEAMACGAFPVASDIPPHRLLTADGAAGELFPPGDVEACAEAIVRASARSACDVRTAVRKRFEEIASWPAIARQAEAAYRVLIDRRASIRAR
jgi:glycosyltransferase involved in cell wall biosynthesis